MDECFLEHCLMILDFILHIYLPVLFPLCVCVSFTDLISCIVLASCMNSSMKCTSVSNGSVNCALKHLTSEKNKNKDSVDTIVLWPILSLYYLIVGCPQCLWLSLLLSQIPFHSIEMEYFRRAASSNLNQ